jgi:hypothetical protein
MSGVGDKLGDLRRKIALARDTANRIAVSAQFGSSAHLCLALPENIERTASYTQLSLHFATQQNDGLLAFLGNEKGAAKNTRMV